MNTQTKKHEQEYIHIKKETLKDIFIAIYFIVAISSIGVLIYNSGESDGYEQGFKEGYSTGVNNTADEIYKWLDKQDCDTNLDFINNKSQKITVKKQDCQYFNWGKPNLLFGTSPIQNGTLMIKGENIK